MPFQADANYTIGLPEVSFSFRVESPTSSSFHILVSVMEFAFCFQVSMWLTYSAMGVKVLGLQHCNPSEYTLARYMCIMTMSVAHTQECTDWLPFPLLWVGSFMLLIQLSPCHSVNMVGHTALVCEQSHLIPLPFLLGR